MSDGILSGLPTLTAPVAIKDECGEHRAVTNAIKWVKRDDVREALRSDETRQKITEVLADNGVQPNTNAMHSWRCSEPDRFPGYCSCVPQLVDDLIDALTGDDDAGR